MSLRDDMAGASEDPMLAQALRHFKASVDAWSDAAYSRPRTVVRTARFTAANWRRAAIWALGCVLAAGSLTGAVYERHHQKELVRIAAQQAAQKAAQERLAAEQAAAANALTKDQDLLATVDSDVSREVPAAMEPLAQLMDDNGTKKDGNK